MQFQEDLRILVNSHGWKRNFLLGAGSRHMHIRQRIGENQVSQNIFRAEFSVLATSIGGVHPNPA